MGTVPNPAGIEPAPLLPDVDPLAVRVAQLRSRRVATARSFQLVQRITRPDGSDPEKFYRQVAMAYRQYAVETRAPAWAIADEAQVPVTTVHRWVAEARRRGYLPQARKGRAG